jgi:hypothetical protein
MNTYTVVGFYSDNAQIWCTTVGVARDPKDAATKAAKIMSLENDSDQVGTMDLSNIEIVAVFFGDLTELSGLNTVTNANNL